MARALGLVLVVGVALLLAFSTADRLMEWANSWPGREEAAFETN
jgi:hypothetical protein